ncbi:MAG: aminotransferase class III-fold pyridoxal phosphate-dependent enzyme [Erythrobacter sp.]|nr:aminotransferase class III-fold pyridoxal phosphate-dependent enzyme [Erythrobacter sp.]
MAFDLTHNQSLEELDKAHLFHASSSIADIQNHGPAIYQSASGVHVHGLDGAEYIDAGAGLWCANIGFGRQEIADVAKQAIEELSFYHLFGGASNPPTIKLATRIANLFAREANAPHLSHVFFGSGGSDANDTNVKMVRYFNNLRGKPTKKKFLARSGAYHGLTTASASLTGIPVFHKAWDLPGDDVIHLTCPHFYRFHEEGEDEADFTDRLINELEEVIAREGADTIAAFIAEPVMGTGGVFVPPAGYFERVQEVLKANDILLIADEVITGFGRLGGWFGTGEYTLRPDIVTLAKGLSSAYFPISASVVGDEIWDVLASKSEEMGAFTHGFTYSGHPVGARIALANIDIIERERLPQNAAEVGPYLLQGLKHAIGDHEFVGDIRGHGLMVGVEFVADKASRRPFDPSAGAHKLVSAACRDAGLLSRALPFIDVMALSPPLILSKGDADAIVERFAQGLDRSTQTLRELSLG